MTNVMRAQIEQLAIVLHMQMAAERKQVPPAWNNLMQQDRDFCRMKAIQMLDEPLPPKIEL